MSKPTQYSIDEILIEYARYVIRVHSKGPNSPLPDKQLEHKKAESELNQLIYTQVLEELKDEPEYKVVQRPVIQGSVDPSPTGTLGERVYNQTAIVTNKILKQRRERAKAKYIGTSE